MSRSMKKGPYVDERLIAKVEAISGRATVSRSRRGRGIAPWCRSSSRVTFLVHNGRNFAKLYVTEDMVGHKLGEFAPTRVFKGHSGGKAKAAAK